MLKKKQKSKKENIFFIEFKRVSSKTLLPIVITGLIFGVIGYSLGKKSITNRETQKKIGDKKQIYSSEPSSTNTLSPTPKLSVNKDNWLTYNSSKSNYSFKYPSEWPITSVQPNAKCDSCIDIVRFEKNYNPNSLDNTIGVILVNKAEQNYSTLEDYARLFSSYLDENDSLLDIEYLTIGSNPAISYRPENMPGQSGILRIREYLTINNGNVYMFTIYDSNELNKDRDRNIALFREMIDTFEFN